MSTETTGTQTVPRAQPGRTGFVWQSLKQFNTVFILAVLLVGSSFVSSDFMTGPNISNISRQVAGIGIMAMGMLLVVLTGGIDLSVGSVAAVASVATSMLIPEYGLPLAVLGGLLAGAICGTVNGLLIARFRLSAFVVTLAMMTIARGVALIVSKGAPVLVDETGQTLLEFGRDTWLGVPQPTALMLLVFLVGGLFLRYMRAGRLVRAIGSNEEAVRLSGVSVGRYALIAYVVSGICAAAAGIVSVARAGVGSPTVGFGDELTVIAAVVIGGASLMGGRGTVLNTLVGVLILGSIANIMNLTGVPGYHQQVVMGVIIVVAILVQRSSNATHH
jgi:ribose transport system permease protein